MLKQDNLFNRGRLTWKDKDGNRVFDEHKDRTPPVPCAKDKAHHYVLDQFNVGQCKYCGHIRPHYPASDYGFGVQIRDDTPLPEREQAVIGSNTERAGQGWLTLDWAKGHYKASNHMPYNRWET